MGLTATTPNGGIVIYVHPDRFQQVVKAHKERPLAIAAFLHGLAVHELTHADGRMGEGHGESYVSAREDLGAATAHLLPAIAVLVTRLLGLPVKAGEDEKRAARLGRELEKARGTVRDLRARVAAMERGAVGAITPGTRHRRPSPAERVVDAAVAAMRTRPPAGVDPDYLDAFLARHRASLVGLVEARMEAA